MFSWVRGSKSVRAVQFCLVLVSFFQSKGKLVEEEDAWLVVKRKWPDSVASWINKALQRHEWMHGEKKAQAAGLPYTFTRNNNTWKAKNFIQTHLEKTKNKQKKNCVSKITTAKATISRRVMAVLTPVRQILQTHTEDAWTVTPGLGREAMKSVFSRHKYFPSVCRRNTTARTNQRLARRQRCQWGGIMGEAVTGYKKVFKNNHPNTVIRWQLHFCILSDKTCRAAHFKAGFSPIRVEKL